MPPKRLELVDVAPDERPEETEEGGVVLVDDAPPIARLPTSIALVPIAPRVLLTLDGGVVPFTRLPSFPLIPIAPSAPRAVEEEVRERLIAVPLTSFSDSTMGSRETNSFCSKVTTT